jgi:hypothetical protein
MNSPCAGRELHGNIRIYTASMRPDDREDSEDCQDEAQTIAEELLDAVQDKSPFMSVEESHNRDGACRTDSRACSLGMGGGRRGGGSSGLRAGLGVL